MNNELFEKQELEDDGSLSFLNIPKDENNKQFNCNTVSQQDLINKTFWILDYIPDVVTKFGNNRYLLECKYDKDDANEDGFKFFTASSQIKYIIDQIAERNAFPRKVTLKGRRNAYWLV